MKKQITWCHLIYLEHLHDGVGFKVGRLLHETSDQQHGFTFSLQAASVRQWLVVRETLSHALLQDDQGLVDIALKIGNMV